MTRRRVLLVGWLLVVGCGVPLDSQPRLYDERVREELEAAVGPQTPEPPDDGSGDAMVDLYFVADGQLSAVPTNIGDPQLRNIVEALVEGPGALDEPVELRTAIPPTTIVRSVSATAGVVRVDLSREFTAVGGQEEILAIAQVVLTLASLPGIEGVQFALEGVEVAVPRADGALVESPLETTDFIALVDEG